MTRWTLLVGMLVAMPLAAQETEESVGMPYRISNFPYLVSTPNDGLFGVARVVRFRQGAWDDRVPNLVEQSLDVGYSTRGSYFARGEYRQFWTDAGWRVRARAELSREVRFGDSDRAASDESQALERSRRQAWVDVTRRLQGPVHLAVRGAVDRQEFVGDQSNLLARYQPALPDNGVIVCVTAPCPGFDRVSTERDVQLRAALVLDTRDNEYNPTRGVLAEVGAFAGSAGNGYSGSYGLARGWLPLHRLTRLTGRIGYRAVTATSAIGIRQEIPAWESPVTTMGGPNSHRALPVGMQVGRSVQLAGIELRHTLLDFGGLGGISALAFVDAGRVAADEERVNGFLPCVGCPTSLAGGQVNEWVVGAGGGLGIRILRAAQLNVTAAKANGSMRWYVSSGWSW